MAADAAEKVTADHLRRAAYLYVRQSTLRQVVENTTSTDRQYALRQRAVALGWAAEQVIVIDEDLGRSGASAQGRDGFQRLVADVGMGRAGIVLGLEVSRLARNNADWHRLLEICALTQTLILDEDGLYDPCSFNDRLVLGLKGAMSEAELHLLKARLRGGQLAKARLRGGQLAKARRGELAIPLPVGFVHDPAGRWSWTPTRACSRPCATCFRPSNAPARPGPPSRPSPTSTCCSRCGCAPGPTAASSAGIGWPTTASCRCCTTPATRARSPMGAAARGAAPTGRPATCCNPARTGSRSSPTRTPAISAGSSSRTTSAA
jgi:DNA invertase Pin-like site-specific DNA recombinase